jgi:hypothetical protein
MAEFLLFVELCIHLPGDGLEEAETFSRKISDI